MAHNVLDTLPFPLGMTATAGITYSSPAGDGSRVNPMATGLMDTSTSPFYDSDGTSITQFRPDLAGKIYSVVDSRDGTAQPKLLRAVQLNCSGNTSSGQTAVPGTAALVVQVDPSNSGKNGYSRGTALQMGNSSVPPTHGREGVVVMQGGTGAATANNVNSTIKNGVANTPPTTGKPAKPLYDGYGPNTILLVGDWVYVVEEGPCIVPLSGDGGAAWTAGKPAQAGTDGGYKDASANATVVGTWAITNNTSVAVGKLGPYQGLLMVKRGYQADTTGTP